jgi:hypothetical protein
MFARKIRVEYEELGQKLPCPIKWLDSFSMRNFTNASVFDDTLPVSDGQMEIGKNVPLDQLKEAMEDWFRRKGYLGKEAELVETPFEAASGAGLHGVLRFAQDHGTICSGCAISRSAAATSRRSL